MCVSLYDGVGFGATATAAGDSPPPDGEGGDEEGGAEARVRGAGMATEVSHRPGRLRREVGAREVDKQGLAFYVDLLFGVSLRYQVLYSLEKLFRKRS